MIVVLLWGTVRSIGRRLMDGIEPELLERAQHSIEHTPGVLAVTGLQLRWVGHRLQGAAIVTVADTTVSEADAIAHGIKHELSHALPNLDAIALTTTARI